MTMKQVFNPFLPFNEYIPDGEPHVFGDRIYLYGSHDKFDGDHYCMNDYVCYSADVKDLRNWKYEGVIYRKEQDPRNLKGQHCLWAPDVTQGLDGRYYLYYCFDVLPEIGVAVSETPTGPYEYLGMVRYEDGTILGQKEDDYIQFDPGIFIDEDKTIYLYSGNGPKKGGRIDHKKNSQVMQLKEDMLTIKEGPKNLLPTLYYGEGTTFEEHEFFEASSVRKINERYYFIYSDVNSYALCYAHSKYPDRDYKYGGQIITLGDIGFDGRTEAEAQNFLGNIHGGIEEINGEWYVFYHRQTNRTQFSRQACAEKIEIKHDGTIEQVEMTSCGLNKGPLIGEGNYMATIACNLWSSAGVVISRPELMNKRFPYFTQDGRDGDKNSISYIANIRDGSTAGYKYFSFNNLESISLMVRGDGEGKIIILTEEKGKAIGEISIVIKSQEWAEFSGKTTLFNGIYPLYFRFEGKGSIDLYSFELIRGSKWENKMLK